VGRYRDEHLRKEVSEKFSFVEKRLITLSRLGLDEKDIKTNYNLIMKSKKVLEGGKIREAHESVIKIIKSIEQLEKDYWDAKLGKERKVIEAMLKAISGKDPKLLTKQQLEVIEKAKRFQETNAFRKAFQTLQESRSDLEKHMKKLKLEIKIPTEPETTKKKLEEVEPEGMAPDVKVKAEKVVKAEKAKKVEKETGRKKVEKEPEPKEDISKPKKKEDVVEKPSEVQPAPYRAPIKRDSKDPEGDSRSLITDVVLLLQKIEKRDLDSSEAKKLLQNAKEEFIIKDYDKANEFAQKARNAIINIDPELFREQAEKDIEELTKFFEDLKAIGVETEPLERNMKLIKDDFNSKEFIKVHDSCEKLADKAKRLKTEFLKVTLSPNIHELMEKVTEKKKKGIDLAEIESYLGDAENSVSEKDFEGGSQLYRKALQLFNEIPEEEDGRLADLTKVFDTLKLDVERCRNYDIDLKEIEKLLNASEKDILQKNYDNASEGIAKTEEQLKEMLKDYTDQKLSRTELEIEDISWSGADTSQADKLLGKGKKLIESSDYHEAIKVLISAERMAVDTGDSFVKLFEGLRRLSREIASLPKDTENYSELRKLRNETKQKLDEKDFNGALGLLNKAMTLLRSAGRKDASLLPENNINDGKKPDVVEPEQNSLKNADAIKKKNDINIKFDLPEHNVALEGGVVNLFIHNSGKKIYRRVEGNCIMLANESPVQNKNFEVDDLMPNSDLKIALPLDAVKNFERENLYQLKIELSDIEGIIAVTGIDINT
jgi:hypothetical protein